MIELKDGAKIENPRQYDCGVIDHLRQVLEVGGAARNDPRRDHFYDLEGSEETYYIHVSPISGNVVLLAKWLRQSQECCASPEEHLVA